MHSAPIAAGSGLDWHAAEQAILARMQEGPFKYVDLHRLGDRILASPDKNISTYRLADKLIQRERKAGRIVQGDKRGDWLPVVSS